jgi:hypothetical protein
MARGRSESIEPFFLAIPRWYLHDGRMEIERTRAKVVRYTRPMPFENGGVWASNSKLTVPVYEETKPYDKIPKEIRDKEMIDLTLADVLLFARAADRPDYSLDRMIWYKVFFDPALKRGEGPSGGGSARRYTLSLDAAKLLYLDVPERMPTDAIDAVVEALEQHREAAR